MKKFLQIEYLKIKGNNSFKVFSLIFIVFLPIIVILLPTIFKVEMGGVESYPLMPKTSTVSWYFTSYVASWFSMFILSFVIIFHITNEYAVKTVRQNIIDGYTKLDFLKSKIGMVIIMAITATFYVFLVGLVAGVYFKANQPVPNTILDMSGLPDMSGIPGLPFNTVTEFGGLFTGILYIVGYFLQVLAYFILAVMISILFRKGALAVMVYFGLFLIEVILVLQLENQGAAIIINFFPLHAFSSLLAFPGWESLFELNAVEPLTLTNSIISIVYIGLFILITRWVFFKRDVV